MVREIDKKLLNKAPYNPRVELSPGMALWEKLKNSILQFGNVRPIVWNERTGNVVSGHQSLSVLVSLGYEKIPCEVVNMSEEEEKLLNIALNKIKGQWDYDKLEEVLRDFDYEVAQASGFSAEEIAVILANNEDLQDDDDYSGWDEEPEEEVVGGSYVVTLVFANAELATEWAEGEGYKDQIREGANTTVIRIEE